MSGISLWVMLSVRGKLRFIVAASYSGIAIISAVSNIGVFFDIAALISIPIALSLLVYNKLTLQKILNANAFHLKLFLNHIATTGIALGALSIVISTARIFSISLEPIPLRDYGYEVFLLFSGFSHIFIFLLVGCIPVKFLMRGFWTGILRAKHNNSSNLLIYSDTKKSRIKSIILITSCMLLCFGLSLISYQRWLNEDDQDFGADTDCCVSWINAMIQSYSIQ